MALSFTKMHSLGNDFVVFDAVTRPVEFTPAQLRRIADRHFGIGCDQVLLVAPATGAGADFRYRIFNADGGEVEACGNGARCFARFVHDRGLSQRREITVETAGGIIRPRLEDGGTVTVDMGAPRFAPEAIPFVAETQDPVYDLDINGERIRIHVVSMGNPHAVQIVDDVERAPVAEQGPLIEHHPRFPQRVNAGFMQVVDRQHARVRVFERGAGETLACGTGACAAVVAGRRAGLLDAEVTVTLRGGDLRVNWAGDGAGVLATGPATTVFEGRFEPETLFSSP